MDNTTGKIYNTAEELPIGVVKENLTPLTTTEHETIKDIPETERTADLAWVRHRADPYSGQTSRKETFAAGFEAARKIFEKK